MMNKNEKDTEKTAVEEPEKATPAAEKDDLAALKAELAETKEKYLRMLAEYDNYRKRTQKEREGAYADGLCDGIAAFLPVLDNLERASKATGEGLGEGLALTLRQAGEVLNKWKVEETAKEGDAFDPNLHNAVAHEDNEEKGEGEISEVYQRGYRRGEKILRHAMVKVAN